MKLAIEGGCNAVASTLGVLGAVARKYAHRIPFIVKFNHNEFLTYPEQVRPDPLRARVKQARGHGRGRGGRHDLLRLGRVGAADRRGERRRSSTRTSWAWPPCSGATCATPRSRRTRTTTSPPTSPARPTTSASRSQADIIKQKLPENNGGFKALSSKENPYGKIDERIYTELTTDHPIDLTRYQVANCYMGRAGLINSGGASGENDFAEAVKTAVINKRAGGMGLISGRKAFQRPMAEGVKLLNAIQDVYLCKEVTVA